MASKRGWREYRKNGVLTIRLSSWEYFDKYVNQHIVDFKDYIFRGQASSKWPLKPTLYRTLDDNFILDTGKTILEHLHKFKLSVRGRRGSNPPLLTEENDWWALGQHFGLATPLLDWTHSPFVAAYFAFYQKENDESPHRIVYALQNKMVTQKSDEILKSGSNDIISTFTPMCDDNNRLVNQGGLFTKTPYGVDIEKWVQKHYEGYDKGVLIKIFIPESGRNLALVNLNRMNINHASLFPDLFGSSKHCNMHLTTYQWPVNWHNPF